MIRPGRSIILALVCLLAFCAWVAGAGCRSESSDAAGASLTPVVLPDLAAVEPSIRGQLNHALDRLQTLENSSAGRIALGQAHGELGGLLYLNDYINTARVALQNAALLDPDELRWPYFLGLVEQRGARLEDAAGWYERALGVEDEFVPALIHLAEVLRDLERPEGARERLAEVVRIDPGNAAAYFILGELAESPQEAVQNFRNVLENQPNATIARYPLGMAYRDLGDLERSRPYLTGEKDGPVVLDDPLLRALEQQRVGAQALVYQGSLLMERRQFQEALTLFLLAVEEDSTYVAAFLNIGAASLVLGRLDSARVALERALALDPGNAKVHLNLAVIAEREDRPSDALTHFRAAVETDPSLASARLGLSRSYWFEEQCAEAIPQFSAFLAAKPDHAEARIRQAMCHVRLGQAAEARNLLEAGLSAIPDHPGIQDALVRVLAAATENSVRDGVKAVEIAEALVVKMRRFETLGSLAMAYAEVGRFEEAAAQQQSAIDLAGQAGNPELLEYLRDDLARYRLGQPNRTPWPPKSYGR